MREIILLFTQLNNSWGRNEILFITELTSDGIGEPAQSEGDLGFLDRGFKFVKGG